MIRGISLRGAIALNVITMIGIGPLITIPLVLQNLAGPAALAGWILGALIALCDGLVWAELGSRYPGSGGTYVYVREIFGGASWGRLFAFLFNWQYVFSIALLIATGYIGFAQYAGFLYAPLAANANLTHLLAVAIGILTIALVYRRITAASGLAALLAVFAIVTVLIVAVAGFAHGNVHRAFTIAPLHTAFLSGLGGALYITLYDYAGYSQIALVGEEVRQPQRTLPLAIVASILIVLALYLFLQVGVLSALPWQQLFDAHGNPKPSAQFVGSTVVANSWGSPAGIGVTVLVLITAFASLYGNLIGAARVPFAAARDGVFLPAFARLHPRGQFPYVAILGIGAISLAACFFTLDAVIAALTAAAILGGALPQIAALFTMRARGERAPFRMMLYPLPALAAAAGWIFAFASTGSAAIVFGTLWLIAGVIVFLAVARSQKAWPFAVLAALVALHPLPAQGAPAKPAFVYGAAFFYERMPRAQWRAALHAYHALGINTIDLYVMWNWHELRDGDFDFTGRTDPRRDLRGLLRLIHDEGYALILRPGPVIRNEWRNGGYPAWLLKRPEYAMPLRDILEGRYAATATYQNAHSDAAAAQWMENATHMRYTARWLRHVYALAAPYKDSIVAVALDDDQGAYIDNDTWPGTHFHRYMRWLAQNAQRGLPGVPVFINTYQMKVTASAPVWAWGNWYQSDTYGIGEHDRAQIEFSTGLLQTQSPRRPIMVSEFQAGWLQGADEARPRAADPSNTTLALHSFLQMGAHGVVNFPVQDTWNPPGWEAPWANALYAWDAALSPQLRAQPRFAPTAAFGALIRAYGPQLAATHPATDAAIAYMTSAYEPSRVTNDDIAKIAAATVSAQERCRTLAITCALVDLRYDATRLRQYPVMIVPDAGIALEPVASVATTLAAYRSAGGRVVMRADDARIARPHAGGIPYAVLLVADSQRYGFLDVVNYGAHTLRTPPAIVHSGAFSAHVGALTVKARSAVLIPLGLPAKNAAAPAYVAPRTRWRMPDSVLNIAPCAGARSFGGIFTAIGGLRDAWTPQLPPSPRDYIGKYTHPMPAGTFNRCYRTSRRGGQSATYTYTAPDTPGGAATFTKTITLSSGRMTVVRRAHFIGRGLQALEISAIAFPAGSHLTKIANGYELHEPALHRTIRITWSAGTPSISTANAGSALVTLTYPANVAVRESISIIAVPLSYDI